MSGVVVKYFIGYRKAFGTNPKRTGKTDVFSGKS
jgi:hypothetical protein